MKDFYDASVSAWRKIELRNVERKYRHPKVIDKKVKINKREKFFLEDFS